MDSRKFLFRQSFAALSVIATASLVSLSCWGGTPSANPPGRDISGGGTSGGGTVIAGEFVNHGKAALQILTDVISGLEQTQIDQALKTAVIDVGGINYRDPFTGSVYQRDAEYDAGKNEIQFDRSKWHSRKCRERLQLSSHEYLRALGIENSDYEYSNRFLGQNFSDDIQKNDAILAKVLNYCSGENFCDDKIFTLAQTLSAAVSIRSSGRCPARMKSMAASCGLICRLARKI